MDEGDEEVIVKRKAKPDDRRIAPPDYKALDAQAAALVAQAAKPGALPGALVSLLELEKAQRLAADIAGTRTFAVAIARACRAAGAWKELNEHVLIVAKRRAQLKPAVVAMVQQCMTYVDEAPTEDARVAFINTLQGLCAGKIYLEMERARLVRRLAGIYEAQGKVDAAADLMQEVAIETFGAMSKQEKISFILEQVRLCLDKGDFVRAAILAKKVNPRSFTVAEEAASAAGKGKGKGGKDEAAKDGVEAVGSGKAEPPKADAAGAAGMDVDAAPAEAPPPPGYAPPMPELKLAYYGLMLRYHQHNDDYLEMCRCLQAMYGEPAISGDESQWSPMLKRIAWCAVLAPHGVEQSTLLHAAAKDKRLASLPASRELLRQFGAHELISWRALSEAYAAEIAAEQLLFGGPKGAKRVGDLKARVTEHNLVVLAKYYSRMTLSRLAELLDLPGAEAEKALSDVVVSKTVAAKIDRPAGVVTFGARLDADALLNGWATGIDKLLVLVEKCGHTIHKELMVHKKSTSAAL